MDKTNFQSIDDYIAIFSKDIQKKLEEVRATIKTVVPDAKEKISYQIPAFELNGKNLIYFAGWKKHISIYPIPSGTEEFNQEIAPYMDGKGTLKFPIDRPLPLELIGRIVKVRMANL